jgi:hypothetical protein
VYFDTQVLSLVARRKILKEDWQRVVEYVNHHAHHCVSLTTMYELLNGAAYGDESLFPEYRNAFAALRINEYQTYLPLVGDFIRERLFGIPITREGFAPSELSRWAEIVIRSTSRAKLLNGLVEINTSDPQSYGFKLRMVQCHILKGKAQYIRRLKVLKAKASETIGDWASRMVYDLRLRLTIENKRVIERALDAVYQHDRSVRTKSVAHEKFNFKKHATSWLDSQQLFYLADPNFIFVTGDAKLIREVSASSQAKRTIHFQDLLKLSRTSKP